MLIIPCGKNYFVFIKTAKTAGSSMVEYLSKYIDIVLFKDLHRKRKKQLFNKLIVVTMDQVLFFQDEFPDICDDSFTFGIVRNPYDRYVSGYLFHPFCRDFSMTEILTKLPTPPILPKYVRWKEEYPKRM